MSQDFHRPTRVAIVGVGNVGATFAYTLMLSGLASEIVLIDRNMQRAEGEAMDLNHAVPLANPAHIWAGSYEDCKGAAVTVITAGSAQKPGETRLDLTQRNVEIFRQIIPDIIKHSPNTLLLIASNPVDILTYAAQKISGLPQARVIGSGTILDTARLRYLLGQHFDVDPRSVHAYIIGEHGDSEVPVWSLANIAGMHLPAFCSSNGVNCDPLTLDVIFDKTRNAAYHIIERKGATYYAIAAGLTRIVEAVLRNQGTVLSVSNHIHDYYNINDIYLSLPAIVDRCGVENFLRLELNEKEIEGLQKSAQTLQEMIKSVSL